MNFFPGNLEVAAVKNKTLLAKRNIWGLHFSEHGTHPNKHGRVRLAMNFTSFLEKIWNSRGSRKPYKKLADTDNLSNEMSILCKKKN